jgi:hypothetical protein
MRQFANNDKRLNSGGNAKYLLSGLMYCEACGASYVMGDRDKYACSSYISPTLATVALDRISHDLSGKVTAFGRVCRALAARVRARDRAPRARPRAWA